MGRSLKKKMKLSEIIIISVDKKIKMLCRELLKAKKDWYPEESRM